MSRPRTVTDAQIDDTARKVFFEHGPGAPVSRIAQRLGVSQAALFQRVGSKEAILRRALGSRHPQVPSMLLEPPPAEDARRALVELLLALLTDLRDVVPGLVVLRSAGLTMEEHLEGGDPPPPVALRRALGRWLKRADASGRLRVASPLGAAEGLLGAVEARAFNAYLGGESYSPGQDRVFINRVLDGVALPPDTP